MLWDALFSEPSKESLALTSPLNELQNLFSLNHEDLFEVGVGSRNTKRKKLRQDGKPSVLDIFRDNLNINLPGDLLSNTWIEVNIDNTRLLELIQIHFLQATFRKVQKINPANRLILLSTCGRSFFIWGISEISGTSAVQCMLFRNTSTNLSSKMISDAEKRATNKWPEQQLFVIINSKDVKSVNPGYCFKRAGWQFVKKLRAAQHLLVKATSSNH